MKPIIRTHILILLILSIISFSSLIYILYRVSTNFVDALNIDKSGFGISDLLFASGHVFILIFHLYAIIFIFSHFHKLKKFKILGIATLVLAVISLFFMGGEKVLFDEIAREYRLGLDVGEVNILRFAYIINLAFSILMFLLLLKTFRMSEIDDSGDTFADEKIFIIAQCMGILSGVLGLYFTFTLIGLQVLANKIWIYIPFYILFLIPYAVAVLYWLSFKRNQKISNWYDEKQFQDILKASLATLLLSVPGLMIFLFFIKIPDSFYWFLYYLFLILLIFSISTLYFFKIKDID